MEDLYFCIKLTEAEHTACEAKLKAECERTGAKFLFWRKLVDGHVPLFREVKVQGNSIQLNEIRKFMHDNKWIPRCERNPWK